MCLACTSVRGTNQMECRRLKKSYRPPTLNDSSDTSLKCSVKDAEDSSKQYYPVGNSDLMRVGWKS